MPTTSFDSESIKQSIISKLQRYHGCTVGEASTRQLYNVVASTARDQIMQKWMTSKQLMKNNRGKKLYYLSIEFLMGRTLYCNMLNLCSTDAYRKALAELGISMDDILQEEPEPGLGNGGLGRLAACFLDSLSSLDLPAMGATIRYEYGLFQQKIVDGQQVELPDDWLVNGNTWETATMEDVCRVNFGGKVECHQADGRMYFVQTGCETVEAVPYDMPIVGYNTSTVNTLRMWRARSIKQLDLQSFGQGDYEGAMHDRLNAELISKVLYPDDTHIEGKRLRLQQHYFFVSATLQYAIKDFKRNYGRNFALLPEKVVFHINDTHPGFAIPELMRILMDDEGLGWEEAEKITRSCFAYTNHTILSEALERWPEDMVKSLLPRIYMILEEMNRRLCGRLWNAFPGDWDRIGHMAILSYGQVQMANLCISMSFSVNGVSYLHGEILKNETFKDYYKLMPSHFTAITNGVTHRRWLMACNPGLKNLLDETIGHEWHYDASQLAKLKSFADDAAFRTEFDRVKQENKARLAKYLAEKQGTHVDPSFIFDIQCKRLHEYKRQLLNALHILVLYNRIVDDPSFTMTPHAFFFGAKAAPGYARAKLIIRFINALAAMIDRHPRARKMLKVVFVENYSVASAEIMIPAAEISEQLSTASKEASGTSNMKFMMNGAVTIGTMDGANVEMSEQVGMDNIYIFGMRADTVQDMYREHNYNPMMIFERNQELRKALTQMIDGTIFPESPALLQDLYHSLLISEYGSMADEYFVLKDFGSYTIAHQRMEDDYNNRDKWLKMAVMNTACSGIFSTDRTIKEYNDLLWHIAPNR